jgi:hypothetical protein
MIHNKDKDVRDSYIRIISKFFKKHALKSINKRGTQNKLDFI